MRTQRPSFSIRIITAVLTTVLFSVSFIVLRTYADESTPASSSSQASTDENTVVPPDQMSAGVTALPGKYPSIAFDAIKKQWLVVSENGNAISGQLMSTDGKPIDKLITIGTGGHTPKAAYSPAANEYLVVWTSSTGLWAQFLAADGSLSGGAFKIDSGGVALYSVSNVEYNPKTQRFALSYEKSVSGVSVLASTIDSSGIIDGPVLLGKVDSINSAPSLAANGATGEYCVSYLDRDALNVQSFSIIGGAGKASIVDAAAQLNAGIVYSSDAGGYVVGWLSQDGTINSKTLTSCANDPKEGVLPIATNTAAGILVPGTNGFALFAINSSVDSDRFITFDPYGGQLGNQSVFAGTWSESAFWGAAAVNVITGQYATVGSPDGNTVKFIGSVGDATAGSGDKTIAQTQSAAIPTNGLPTDLGQLIGAVFVWALSIVGMVVFVRFFWAGIKWGFMSAGNAAAKGEAQTIMKNAALGAAILFSAYLILNTINPDLISNAVKLPGLPASQPAAPVSANNKDTSSGTPTHFCGGDPKQPWVCTNSGKGCGCESDCGGVDPATSACAKTSVPDSQNSDNGDIPEGDGF